MNRITIIGAGELGTAFASLLRGKRGIHLELWDTDPMKVSGQKQISEIAPPADIIFLCVPTAALRPALNTLAPLIARKTIVVSCAKGIEQKSRKTADEIFAQLLPSRQPFVVIGGPMLAEELQKGMFAFAVCATRSQKSYGHIKKIFEKTRLHLEYSHDVHGVALCGVLKNIYAIGLGIGDGLAMGDNFRGQLLTQAIREMLTLVPVLGGKKETVLGLSGVGDLIATGLSKYSSNYTVGYTYGKGEKCDQKSEGRLSIASLVLLLKGKKHTAPLLGAIKKILDDKQDAKSVFGLNDKRMHQR